jgi:hypothetical protein
MFFISSFLSALLIFQMVILCRGQPGTVNWPEMGDRGDTLDDVSLGRSIQIKEAVLPSVAEPEPQGAASFGRSRSRNAMRLRLRLRKWY